MKLLASSWGLVQVVMVVCKLCGWDVDWWQVMFPTWAPCAMLVVVFIVFGILELKDRIERGRE